MSGPSGTAPPAAVRRALAVLAPLGERVVPGGAVGPLTTYRVGGPAAGLVTVRSDSDLELVAAARAETGLPLLVVGRGSNLLVADAGFPGLAVLLDADHYGRISIDPPLVTAGAAVALPALARQSVEAGLTGLEWAVGVPGSVGGGVRMNAGGHGSDMARTLDRARIFDLATGRERNLAVADLDYGYRHSSVRAEDVVVEAVFGLAPGDPEAGRKTIREIVRWRRDHQPGGQNAGSVFTNPPGDSAGRLIEAAGLKGRRLRTAMVSPKHANFIQADPGGSADDVVALMGLIRAEVEERFGVPLRAEVRLVGFPDQPSSGALGSGHEGEGS
ncbi:MAG TPA: UDP-N-acetylmuramate dehydrogenase [Acidimicrobiales bacterium]|nr:UDP-N-acetylmuramate dehydrogenase [Acidimicrobiales bacterium]